MFRPKTAAAAVLALSIIQAGPALAYVGPGAGLSAIGSVFAVFGVILLMVMGFFWYPLKRLFARSGNTEASEEGGNDAA